MQLCTVHTERVAFEASNPDRDAERDGVQTGAAVDSALAVFVAVELGDESRAAGVSTAAATTIESVSAELKTPAVVLVPAPQLSDEAGTASVARDILAEVDAQLDCETHRVPMGWDIAYDIETKAHPFAIQSFDIDAPEVSDSEWLLSQADGSLRSVESGSVDERLCKLLAHERESTGGGSPEYLSRGERLQLFEADESGWRLLPRGVVARNLLQEWTTARLQAFGARQVEQLGGDRKPAGDPLSLLRGTESPEELPARVFDCRHGRSVLAVEGTGIPAATVPELVSLVADGASAREELLRQLAWIYQTLSLLDLASDPVIRLSPGFRDEHSKWLGLLSGTIGGQTLVEVRDAPDWPLQVEFVVRADDGRPVTRPTVVLDERTPAQHGISRSGGGKRTPVAVRAAPVGAIEQLLAAMVATAAADELPCWLAPTQLRFIPIEPDEHRAFCVEQAAAFSDAGIRVDIDDRDISVRERLANADQLEIPYDCVVGDDELERAELRVSVRAESSEKGLRRSELQDRIERECTRPRIGYNSSARFVSACPARSERDE